MGSDNSKKVVVVGTSKKGADFSVKITSPMNFIKGGVDNHKKK